MDEKGLYKDCAANAAEAGVAEFDVTAGDLTPSDDGAAQLDAAGHVRFHRAASLGVIPQPPPMPKWPADHKSSAFEAVSFKKSLLLSPPEIYAEMAHHGAFDMQRWLHDISRLLAGS